MATTNKTPTKKETVLTGEILVKPGRSRGRPSGVGSRLLDRGTIVALALQLTKSVPLSEVSIVRMAREMGVTPALIHYYLGEGNDGARGTLTSGVMNAFYREMVEQWPAAADDWQHSLEVIAHAVYRIYLRYPGVAMYLATHNRYMVVQDVREGETDYGLVHFENYMAAVRRAGFNAERTGIYTHLLAMFVASSAHATVTHRWPGQHSKFLMEKLSALDEAEFPATHYVLDGFAHMNAAEAFAIGLGLWIQSLAQERDKMIARVDASP